MCVCSFFGWSEGDYREMEGRLLAILCDLIENHSVRQFYSGGRGAFDEVCAKLVGGLRQKYPQIRNTLVLSYMPTPKSENTLKDRYTDSVYLLERNVPPRYAIVETNKKMIDMSAFVVVATKYSFGGAKRAREYAEQRGKTIIDVYEKVNF